MLDNIELLSMLLFAVAEDIEHSPELAKLPELLRQEDLKFCELVNCHLAFGMNILTLILNF